MIDSHCHLEQPDYDKDRDDFIEHLKKELKAIVTSCAKPEDFEKTLEIVERHKGFAFACIGLHPEHIRNITEKELEIFLERIKLNKDKIVGIGEIGLDFYWVKERIDQEKQKELFKQLIAFSKEIRKPMVIHCRDAHNETLDILEKEDAKHVLLHMWGEKNLLKRIEENGFYISIGPIIDKSKNHKKIARDFPIDRILLETDSPWFGGKTEKGDIIRGTPLNIKIPAGRIAEIKKISFEEVWKKCGENAVKFYKLPLSL